MFGSHKQRLHDPGVLVQQIVNRKVLVGDKYYVEYLAAHWTTYKLNDRSVATLLTVILNELRAVWESFGNRFVAANKKSTILCSELMTDRKTDAKSGSGN